MGLGRARRAAVSRTGQRPAGHRRRGRLVRHAFAGSDPDGLGDANVRRGVVAAFQSYPTLLAADGEVPAALREPGRGIDVEHRDARLGMGALPDGRLLIVLTRFDALGESLGSIPFGPTIPEFAALMGALGARQAVALDGGISGQMLVRDEAGITHTWRGLRRVPMALVALRKR